MSKIIDSRHRWPLPTIREARDRDNLWVRISEEHRDHMLGAVPPIYFPGGFMLGEEAASTPQGEPIYTAVVELSDGRILARDLPISQRVRAHALAVVAGKVSNGTL